MADPMTLVQISDLVGGSADTLDEDEQREAQLTLDVLSDYARSYGSNGWSTPDNTPRSVKNLILVAARRYMKNWQAFTISRAGDEQVAFTDLGAEMGTPTFTKAEQSTLAKTAGALRGTLRSVPVVAWHSTYDPRPLPPDAYDGKVAQSDMLGYFVDLNP